MFLTRKDSYGIHLMCFPLDYQAKLQDCHLCTYRENGNSSESCKF